MNEKIKTLNRLLSVCSDILREYEEDKNSYEVNRYKEMLISIKKEIEHEKRSSETRTREQSSSSK